MINNVLRKVLKVAAPIVLVTTLGFSEVSFGSDDFEASFEDGLNEVSSGSDRFRYGFLLNVGFQGGSQVDIPNTTENFKFSGAAFEVGGYTMISAIQDTLDIEVGTVYNMLISSTDANGVDSSSAEYLSFYAALVALPAKDYGISLGYIYVPNALSPKITATSLVGVAARYAKILGGNGLFIEYQGVDPDGFVISGKLQYTKLIVGRNNNSLDVGVTSLNIGFKY